MKRTSPLVLLLLAVGLSAGCNKGKDERGKLVEPENAQAEPQQSKLEAATLKMFDSYPEYDELRHPNLDNLIESLPEYKQAVADHDARVNAKAGSISDPELRAALVRQTQIPEVRKDDFYSFANKEIERKRAAFLAEHKDCYFIVGTYEFYLPKKQLAVFNLTKRGGVEHADDFVRVNGFGQNIPYRKDKYGHFIDSRRRDTYSNLILYDFARDSDSDEGLVPDSDVISDKPIVSLSTRYQQDWLNDDDLLYYGVAVPVPLGQMDNIYAAVRNKFSKQIDDIFASEMKVGGDYNPLLGWVKYDSGNSDSLKRLIESYVRRQGIWILAQGDPMNPEKMRVDKAWVTVGPDIFVTLK